MAWLDQLNRAIVLKLALLHQGRLATQQLVHRECNIRVHRPGMAAVHFHRHRKGRFSRTLQNSFLGASPACFVIAEGDRLNPTDKITQRRVLDQIRQRIAVGCGHQHHAAFGDGACRLSFQLCADLIDDDDLRHVVFNRLDHHLMLLLRTGNLHPSGPSDRRVRNIAITSDLIAGVDHNDPALKVIGENPGDLT